MLRLVHKKTKIPKRKNRYKEKKFFHEQIRYKIRTQEPEDEQKTVNIWVKQ
jgi:hypothetical protein